MTRFLIGALLIQILALFGAYLLPATQSAHPRNECHFEGPYYVPMFIVCNERHQ